MSDTSLASARGQWQESRALPDEELGAAYEALGGKGRAVLKLCIARLFCVWGELPRLETTDRRYSRDFRLVSEEKPAPFALFVCQASYTHPSALIAAVMPAILAGVDEILPVFVTDANTRLPAPPLMAAMELAGVERCFSCTQAEARTFLRLLCDELYGGRLILLGDPSFGEELVLAAHRKGLVCRSLVSPPVFKSASSGTYMEQRFDNTTPDNRPRDRESPHKSGAEPDLPTLDANNDHVWLWPDISPAWFRNRRFSLTS